MNIIQKEINLKERSRGFHVITDEIISKLPEIKNVKTGIANIFLKHTSASISINENADPDVRLDMEDYYNYTVPENLPFYRHTAEGPDDMTSHIKSSLLGNSLTVTISNGKFNLGTWQVIYLCEHRNNGGIRKILMTIIVD